jgi:hypothetical protein
MGEQGIVAGNCHTTKNQTIARAKRMDIETMANPKALHEFELWWKSFANYNHGKWFCMR